MEDVEDVGCSTFECESAWLVSEKGLEKNALNILTRPFFFLQMMFITLCLRLKWLNGFKEGTYLLSFVKLSKVYTR